ncbi:uncharacterized protein F4822DRAFT_308222 [Hypoxylon trugodes]|uniref:uncharacterized protein n=1 Tax=Hypoxylon trugodes TaxID=326681 RepID=UPI0021976E00|nr:uncharacterized protein F4822DRAFT_308222 [Hypoxylon trugodes]KAI1386194.1 hypothetical protein F4822DRAFT_308222 [Hypoxylon trugodes]
MPGTKQPKSPLSSEQPILTLTSCLGSIAGCLVEPNMIKAIDRWGECLSHNSKKTEVARAYLNCYCLYCICTFDAISHSLHFLTPALLATTLSICFFYLSVFPHVHRYLHT